MIVLEAVDVIFRLDVLLLLHRHAAAELCVVGFLTQQMQCCVAVCSDVVRASHTMVRTRTCTHSQIDFVGIFVLILQGPTLPDGCSMCIKPKKLLHSQVVPQKVLLWIRSCHSILLDHLIRMRAISGHFYELQFGQNVCF